MKQLITLLAILFCYACQDAQIMINVSGLSNNDSIVPYVGKKGINRILFKDNFTLPIQSYKIYSSGESSFYDPTEWVLKGTFDGNTWIILDERKDQVFCSRFQEIICCINTPSNYKQYMIEMVTNSKDTLKINGIRFFENNLLTDWYGFNYPDIFIENNSFYKDLIQEPEIYIKYHIIRIIKILYFTSHDPLPPIEVINYKFRNKPETNITSVLKPICKLDYEIRGELIYDLARLYQFEPKGVSKTDKEYLACKEGLANAVRAEAGYLDKYILRKPAGHWLDGNYTTGFFLQWLTTKDPDAIRKFNQTIRDMEAWNFDKAIKKIFGEYTSIDILWNEYQAYLKRDVYK